MIPQALYCSVRSDRVKSNGTTSRFSDEMELYIDFSIEADYNYTRKLQSFEFDYYEAVIYVYRKGRRA